jgi:hypothetical protein|tara:strand:+ start:595 stop:795 length:201 start_codon:yes stop_codon:yes gene_type:complete
VIKHEYGQNVKESKNVMMGKIRPQIFLAILVLGVLAIFGVINEMPEISTGTIGGIIALGMKILEAE